MSFKHLFSSYWLTFTNVISSMTSVAIKPAILDVITGLWVPRSLISSSIVYLLLLSDSDHLLVSVSASYWRLLPGSRRSMATATSVALGLEWDPWRPFLPLTPCFQLWFLLGMCWVWSFAYRSFDRGSSRSYFKSKATDWRKSQKAFRCFWSTILDFKC